MGYTATRYQLDGYPLTNLLDHTGRHLEAQVVATFLPGGVIDSLYAVMRQAGLEVASLTLEPIAALNAAIPADLRLLNLCLVDIGAGTSDIAVCRDGSVVGYTMATVAGDEITEALMKEFLVDYATAEEMKARLDQAEPLNFTDILGQEQSCDQPAAAGRPGAGRADCWQRRSPSRCSPSTAPRLPPSFWPAAAANCPDCGRRWPLLWRWTPNGWPWRAATSRLPPIPTSSALEDPEYTTPLGIAVSAGLGLISDSCQVLLNGSRAKLFRSGDLSAMDLLMMNGYTYFDLLGKTGKPLVVQVDGRRTVFHGQPAQPARLSINGREAQPSAPVARGRRGGIYPRCGRCGLPADCRAAGPASGR